MHIFYKKLLSPLLALLFIGLSFSLFGQASADGADLLGLGVGYGGGLGAPGISYNLLKGYTGTTAPNITASYEGKFSRHFGLGVSLDYTSAMYTGNNIPYSVADPNNTIVSSGTVTDKVSGTYFGVGARLVYHLSAGNKFDPYAGLLLGATLTSESHTISSDSTGTFVTHDTFAGILLGGFIGLRYFVSDQVAIYIEGDYSGMPSYLGNIGITYQISHF